MSRIISPIGRLLRAFGGWSSPERLIGAVLVGYFDDAGNPSDNVHTVGGIVADEPSWEIFERRARRLLDENEIRSFHTHELRRQEGAFAGWSDERCQQFTASLFDCLLDNGALCLIVDVSIDRKAFEHERRTRLASEWPLKSARPPSSCAQCFYEAAIRMQEHPEVINFYNFIVGSNLSVIFESGPRNAELCAIGDEMRAHGSFANLRLKGLGTLPKNDDNIALQTADFIAHFSKRLKNGLLPPYHDWKWARESTAYHPAISAHVTTFDHLFSGGRSS